MPTLRFKVLERVPPGVRFYRGAFFLVDYFASGCGCDSGGLGSVPGIRWTARTYLGDREDVRFRDERRGLSVMRDIYFNF